MNNNLKFAIFNFVVQWKAINATTVTNDGKVLLSVVKVDHQFQRS